MVAFTHHFVGPSAACWLSKSRLDQADHWARLSPSSPVWALLSEAVLSAIRPLGNSRVILALNSKVHKMTELSATEVRSNERLDSWLDEQYPSHKVMTAVPGLRFRAAAELVRRLKLPVVCSQLGRALLGRLFDSGTPK